MSHGSDSQYDFLATTFSGSFYGWLIADTGTYYVGEGIVGDDATIYQITGEIAFGYDLDQAGYTNYPDGMWGWY